MTSIGERLRAYPGPGLSLEPPPSPILRVLGAIGIVGGVLLVSAFVPFIDWGPNGVAFRIVGFNAGAIAIAAAFVARVGSRASRLARVAAFAAIATNLVYAVLIVAGIDRPRLPEPDPEFRLWLFYGGVAMWLADGALGFVLLRRRGIARLGALALAVGSPLAVLGIDRLALVSDPGYGPFVQLVALTGAALNGVGWIVIGASLALAPRAESPA